jgi:uncharacterized protein YndB with AHSA1/START domain
MSSNTRTIRAAPAKVWKTLADGWLYPLWVVGATRMRDVDESWPAVGAKLHHGLGAWPIVIDDYTEVLDVESGRSLRLRARGWPAGEAEVVISLTPQDGGTRVEITEDVVGGPGRMIPGVVRTPLLEWRNAEGLRRLAAVVEGR